MSKDFKSQKEIWEYLINGGVIIGINNNKLYKLINGDLFIKIKDWEKVDDVALNVTYWKKHTEPKKIVAHILENGDLFLCEKDSNIHKLRTKDSKIKEVNVNLQTMEIEE